MVKKLYFMYMLTSEKILFFEILSMSKWWAFQLKRYSLDFLIADGGPPCLVMVVCTIVLSGQLLQYKGLPYSVALQVRQILIKNYAVHSCKLVTCSEQTYITQQK